MDEGYFLFFEDADYCRRAREAGWKVLYWPEARVVHLRGGSGPVKSYTAQRKRLPSYYYESRARYFTRFHGRSGFLAANVLWLVGRAIAWPRELLGSKAPGACRFAWWDIWRVGGGPRPGREPLVTRGPTDR
jgi:GT2 family glycosyltransferase